MALVIALIVRSSGPSGPDPGAPRYIPIRLPATNSFTWENYDWLRRVGPSHNEALWIYVSANPRFYRHILYDWADHELVGEMTNGAPVLSNNDGTKLLCEVDHSTFQSRVAEQITKFLQKAHLRRRVPPVTHESFALLDTRDNTVKYVGELLQFVGYGSSWVPSPGLRYGYNKPTAFWTPSDGFYVCDLETDEFKKIDCTGDTHGWWDAENVIITRPTNNFLLCNVATGKTTNLFTADQIKQLLQQNNFTNCDVTTFTKWKGKTIDVYLVPTQQRSWGKGFLIKVNQTNRSLTVLDRDFQFRWLGHLDPSDRYYLYSGEIGSPGQGDDGSVLLRDLRDNSVRTLVPPTISRQYSLCRFDETGTGVFYVRSNHIWHIDLNGSNNVPLFAPDKSLKAVN